MNTLLRMPDVMKGTGLARPTIYRDVRRGLFPPLVKLSQRASAWPEHEVAAINAARIAGKSDDEIKALVADLQRQRTNAAA